MAGSDATKRHLAIRQHAKMLDTLNELDCDPIKELATIAKDPNVDVGQRIKVLCDLANYIHPKKKAIDISSGDESGIVVRIKRFSAQEPKAMVANSEEAEKMVRENYDDGGSDTEVS